MDIQNQTNCRTKYLTMIQSRYLKTNLHEGCIHSVYILELSKVLMYEFHYEYIKNKYGNNSRLLFTDTDSLMYEIKTEDAYEDFNNDEKIFEFSNYSSKSKYYDN